IPNLDFFLAWPSPAGQTPFEDLFIRSTLQSPFDKSVVIDAQKPRAASVEEGRIVNSDEVARRKFPRGMQPNLIEHSGKIDEPFRLLVVTAGGFHCPDLLI